MAIKNVSIVTLGCSKNEIDSELMMSILKDNNYKCVPISFAGISYHGSNTVVEEDRKSEEEWLKDLKSKKKYVLDTKELSQFFEVRGFAMGFCFAKHRETGEEVTFDFINSPDSGKRYYFA